MADRLSSYAEDSFRSWISRRGIFPVEEKTYRHAFEQSYLGLRNSGVNEQSSIEAALTRLHIKPTEIYEDQKPRRNRTPWYVGLALVGTSAVALVGFGKQLHVTPWDVYSQFNKPQQTQTEPAPTETPIYCPFLPETEPAPAETPTPTLTPDNTSTSQSNDE